MSDAETLLLVGLGLGGVYLYMRSQKPAPGGPTGEKPPPFLPPPSVPVGLRYPTARTLTWSTKTLLPPTLPPPSGLVYKATGLVWKAPKLLPGEKPPPFLPPPDVTKTTGLTWGSIKLTPGKVPPFLPPPSVTKTTPLLPPTLGVLPYDPPSVGLRWGSKRLNPPTLKVLPYDPASTSLTWRSIGLLPARTLYFFVVFYSHSPFNQVPKGPETRR